MPDVVLVVDMLRGFLEEGHNLYCGDDARKIIPNVQSILEKETGKGSSVLYVCDTHDPDDLEFQMFPVHCVRGTVESEVIPELAPYPGERIDKQRYSAFYNTNLEQRLKDIAPTGSSSAVSARTSAYCTPPPTPGTGTTPWRSTPTGWHPSTRMHINGRYGTWGIFWELSW